MSVLQAKNPLKSKNKRKIRHTSIAAKSSHCANWHAARHLSIDGGDSFCVKVNEEIKLHLYLFF